MTRTRDALLGRLLRSALTASALAGVVTGIALLHGAAPASADDGISAEFMQGPLVVLPDTTLINEPPSAPPTTVGDPSALLSEPLTPLSPFVVTQVDPGAAGAELTPPASIDASDVSTLLAELGGIEGTDVVGSTGSFTTDSMASLLGG